MIITFPRFVLATKNRRKQDGGDDTGRGEEGTAVGHERCNHTEEGVRGRGLSQQVKRGGNRSKAPWEG